LLPTAFHHANGQRDISMAGPSGNLVMSPKTLHPNPLTSKTQHHPYRGTSLMRTSPPPPRTLPKSLSPKPQTPNLKPDTPTPILKPQTLNPEPQLPNHKPKPMNPKDLEEGR
jgi:hypothetical protein